MPSIEKFNFPEKLLRYLDEVEKVTGRKIEIEVIKDPNVLLTGAYFIPHYKYIYIKIYNDIIENIQQEYQGIAHEVTHGYMIYKLGFYYPIPSVDLIKSIIDSVETLSTMINDMVDNKILQDEGFLPYSNIYFITMQEEIYCMSHEMDYYRQFNNDLLNKRRFMIHRYVTAWGFKQYFQISDEQKEFIEKFLNDFKIGYPDIHDEAEQIIQIILGNNIFTPLGNKKIMETILKMWNLDLLIDLKLLL
jgi:hypothetical protein